MKPKELWVCYGADVGVEDSRSKISLEGCFSWMIGGTGGAYAADLVSIS